MNKYLRDYLNVHLKYWYLYFVSFGTMIVGYIFALISAMVINIFIENLNFIRFLMIIIFAIISSFPLLKPNRIVAEKYCEKQSSLDMKRLMLQNQGATLVIYIVVGIVLFF